MFLHSTLPFFLPLVPGFTSLPDFDISVPSNEVPQDDITDTVFWFELDLQDLAFQNNVAFPSDHP